MSALEEFLGIRRAVALWEARANVELGGVHGLGLSDFAALHAIDNAPGEKLRRVDLAQRLALTPSGVTRLLSPLERRGIVTREEAGHDARATFAVLTKSGRALVKDATATVQGIAQQILGSLGERDRAAFAKLITP
ncbi:MAG TPA: MarR family transcriptional regulator [Polyangiaceae bacterium]|jgi:DNA-binding MarR family transcriptional regulator|nr:MarR family transcriptional regulator [Polyangiaceae bacterium]